MEMKITTIEGKAGGSVELSDAIFGLSPRPDLLQRCVRWQLAKRRAGTHKVKNRAEIWRTGKKMYRQKGTGSARHGSARVNLFRGGGRSFGPVVRSHEIGMPKKVRALALKHALSAKAKDGGIVVLDKASVADAKTKALAANFAKLGFSNALIIDGAEVDASFALAARNILPPRHLEPVLQALVHAGILKGIRGPRGGYQLGRERRRITAEDILRAAQSLEEDAGPAVPKSPLLSQVVLPAVAQADRAFSTALARISVEELAVRAQAVRQ